MEKKESTQNTSKRKKPLFLRRDWYKKIKLGKGVKKNQKWRGAKGRHNKTRLGRKGYGKRPKVGYGENLSLKNKINGKDYIKIENTIQLKDLKPNQAIIISSVGLKKRKEIISKAKEMKLIVLNKYKEKKEWILKRKKN